MVDFVVINRLKTLVKKSPLWKLLYRLQRFFLYGTWACANYVSFIGKGRMYVNRNEQRGRRLLELGGVTQRRLVDFWRTAVTCLKPNVVLDVGVNYGECVFSAVYPVSSKIFGIEANPELAEILESSRRAHRNAHQIQLFNVAVSDSNYQAEFHVDRAWSGKSSLAVLAESRESKSYSVPAVTIASLFKTMDVSGTLLFKVDIEGYEEKALKGMLDFVARFKIYVGFVEFDDELLTRAGVQVEDYWRDLHRNFREIYWFDRVGQLGRVTGKTLSELRAQWPNGSIHTDIVLASSVDVANSIVEKLQTSRVEDFKKVEKIMVAERC